MARNFQCKFALFAHFPARGPNRESNKVVRRQLFWVVSRLGFMSCVYRVSRVAVLAALVPLACERKAPPGGEPDPAASARPSGPSGVPGDPTLPDELTPKPTASAAEEPDAAPVEHKGPWFVVTSAAAGVYRKPHFDRSDKIGYVRNGGKVGVQAKPVSTDKCKKGWLEVVGGGYLCANLGTTDLKHPQVKFALKRPDKDEVLPYTYARNAKNGTPLYKSVPSREQMYHYEPYLAAAKKAKQEKAKREKEEKAKAAAQDTGAEQVTPASTSPDAGLMLRPSPDAGVAVVGDAAAEIPKVPWWQRENAKDSLHEVTLEELAAESDDILAKRMVSGFYVAVDKTFRWNNRTWYKTTRGLVAPADRFWQTPGSKFQGVELDGDKWKLPIAWVYGGRKKAPTYEMESEDGPPKPAKSVKSFTAIQLTGRERKVGKTHYLETKDNTWIKRLHVRVTRPGPPPKDLTPNEKWVDVNLKTQTLVAYRGTTPVFATLISSGKRSSRKEKDHRTPLGEWRVREKHITTTMDGNGTAAGDLPYSIEDVPYVMYYYNSYAIHGAFWHRNYGIRMSHGCVNLSPLDAKRVFFLTDPPVAEGFHGAWSSKDTPGSRIIVHE